MNPFTRNFVCGRLDKETSSALISLESSYGFEVEVKFKNHMGKFPYYWTIINRDDWRFMFSGTEMTWKSVERAMKSVVEDILTNMGETKKSIVMKSRLRGGK